MKSNETIREQLHEILDLVLDTNGFERRTRSHTGSLPTVFLDFSGHVNSMNIRLYKDGWVPSTSLDIEWNFYLDETINPALIESMRTEFANALTEKKESDVLRRDIEKLWQDIESEKAKLREMKKKLRKKEKKEKKENDMSLLTDNTGGYAE